MTRDNVSASPAWYLGATPLATRAWLVRLRWTTAAIDTAVVLTLVALPGLDLTLDHLAPLIVAAAGTRAR